MNPIHDFRPTHYWRVRKWLPERFAEKCQLLKTGAKRHCLIEFEDGYRVRTMLTSIRKLRTEPTGDRGYPEDELGNRVGMCRIEGGLPLDIRLEAIGSTPDGGLVVDINKHRIWLEDREFGRWADLPSTNRQALLLPLEDRYRQEVVEERDWDTERVLEAAKDFLARCSGFMPSACEIGLAVRLGEDAGEIIVDCLVEQGYLIRTRGGCVGLAKASHDDIARRQAVK